MSPAAQDGTTGKELEAQGSGLFVALECRVKGALKFTQQIETEEHRQESRLGGEERTQAEVISSQFILELVNAALHGGAAIVIAPDFQSGIAAIGDKDPEYVTGQVNEPAAHGRLLSLNFFAHHHKATRAFPVPEFKVKLAD